MTRAWFWPPAPGHPSATSGRCRPGFRRERRRISANPAGANSTGLSTSILVMSRSRSGRTTWAWWTCRSSRVVNWTGRSWPGASRPCRARWGHLLDELVRRTDALIALKQLLQPDGGQPDRVGWMSRRVLRRAGGARARSPQRGAGAGGGAPRHPGAIRGCRPAVRGPRGWRRARPRLAARPDRDRPRRAGAGLLLRGGPDRIVDQLIRLRAPPPATAWPPLPRRWRTR